MEQKARRKDQTSKHKAKAKSGEQARASSEPPADQPSSSTVGVRSVLRCVVARLKQSALFSWLRDSAVTLQQRIVGNRSWPVVLVEIGLWVLLLWLLSNLHMGMPCFLLALVYWLYNTITEGRGPAPANLHQLGVGEARASNLCPL